MDINFVLPDILYFTLKVTVAIDLEFLWITKDHGFSLKSLLFYWRKVTYWMAWRWVNLQQIKIFGWTVPLNDK